MPEVFNLDLDEELLSHLCDPDAWVVLRGEGFKDVLVQDDEVREIYRWVDGHLREHGAPPTPTVLAAEFDLDLTDPETVIGDLIDRLRQRYMNTRGREALKKIGTQFNEDPTQVPKLLVQQGKELTDLLNRRGEMYGTGDFDRARKRYYDKATQGPGPSLGHEALDDYFYGQRGVTIFLGPPKTWKSWFMVKATIANAEASVYPWLYSLELPAEETDMRARCMMAQIPWWKYIKHAIAKNEMNLMEEASTIIDELGVYKITKPPPGERSLEELVGRAQDAGAQVVFIDQLQYVEVEGKSLGAWNETGKYFDVLDHARNLSDAIPICFAHQFNRTTIKAEEMPSVQQAKGSSAIEETATLVLGLWASKEMRKSKQMEVGTLAARNANFRNWEVEFDLYNSCSFEITKVVDDE